MHDPDPWHTDAADSYTSRYPAIILAVTDRCLFEPTESEICGAPATLIATLASCCCTDKPRTHFSVADCPGAEFHDASLCDLHGARMRSEDWVGLRRLRSITTPPPSKENPDGD